MNEEANYKGNNQELLVVSRLEGDPDLFHSAPWLECDCHKSDTVEISREVTLLKLLQSRMWALGKLPGTSWEQSPGP